MPEYNVDNYLTWGSEIHDLIENDLRTVCLPNTKIIDVVKFIEMKINDYCVQYLKDHNINIECGSAFPVGININNVAAHWTPLENDMTRIMHDDVVKLDYGIHFDGYILDSAFTFAYNKKYINLIECNINACQKAAIMAKYNVPIFDISTCISDEIQKYGFNTIKDICGHQIKPYKIHAGFPIPNFKLDLKIKFNKGDIFAIEPFVTNGNGITFKNMNDVSHYMFNYLKYDFNKISKKKILTETIKKYKTLAFNYRHIVDTESINLLKILTSKNIYEKYPPITENMQSQISQFETTVYIKSETETINYKKHQSVEKYILC